MYNLLVPPDEFEDDGPLESPVIFIFILSLLFKLNDTFNTNLNISYYVLISGTAWFHILSSIGYGMLLIQI